MASKTFNLDALPKGYYMSWFVTTQAANLVTATLKDNSKTYFNKSKQSTDINPPLAQGADTIAGENLIFEVDIPESSEIRASVNSYNITDQDGAIVGYAYNIALEDYIDNDYNDVFMAVEAWKNRK